MSVYRKINLDDCLDELSNLYYLAAQIIPDKIECYKDGKEQAIINLKVRTKDIYALKQKVESLKFD